MPDRNHAVRAATEALRNVAPGECRRIWGRAAEGPAPGTVSFGTHDPDDDGPAGSVWAGDPDDIARVVLDAAERADQERGIHRVDLGGAAGPVDAQEIGRLAEALDRAGLRTTELAAALRDDLRVGSDGQVRAHDDWCPDVRNMASLSAALLAHRDHDPEQGTVDQAQALIARGDADREQLRTLLDWLLRNHPGPEVDRAANAFVNPTMEPTPVAESVIARLKRIRSYECLARLADALQSRPNHDPDEGAVEEALRLIARVDEADMQFREVGRLAETIDRLHPEAREFGTSPIAAAIRLLEGAAEDVVARYAARCRRNMARLSQAVMARHVYDPDRTVVDQILRALRRAQEEHRELATAVADLEAAEERLLTKEGRAVRDDEDQMVARAPDETGQAVRDRRGGPRFPDLADQLAVIADCLNRHGLWDGDVSTGAAAVRLIEQARGATLELATTRNKLTTAQAQVRADGVAMQRHRDRIGELEAQLHQSELVSNNLHQKLTQTGIDGWKRAGETIVALVFDPRTVAALEYESYPPDQEAAWSRLAEVVKGIRSVMSATWWRLG